LALERGSDEAPSWLERRVDSLERGFSFFGGGGRDERAAEPRNVQRAQSSSVADIAVRLDRMENQMRQLNGRIEEMQHQVKRNDEALKRFQGDIDFRLQDLEGGRGGGAKPTRRSDAGEASEGGAGAPPSASRTAAAGGLNEPGSNAPPATAGSVRPAAGGSDQIGGLIDESGPGDNPNGPISIRPPGAGQGASGEEAARLAARSAPPSVTAGSGSARDQFDLGVGFVQRRDYDQAEATFRDFLRAYPNDARAPEARYWLGESLYQRRKYTDAADSFFTIYKDAPQSSKAPESMLKLGMSLNGMGKKEEACATIAEAGRKYARIKAQSDRELKRIAC
jgi:tol-pal system protein YbgF